ncbi:Palmitoyltransferase ERF2 [Rhypophila sp. PSN 637]
MASNDGSARPGHEIEDHGPMSFPQYPRTAGGPPSIVSSRMTDIGSDDGADNDAQDRVRSGFSSEAGGASRPATARTGISSNRGHTHTWSQSQQLRRGLSGARRGSGTASSNSPRPPSSSHVPSLTSHAFFRPMSSQKLQAQRGGPRPPAGSISRQQSPFQAAPPAEASSVASGQQHGTQAIPLPVPVPVPHPEPFAVRPLDDEPRPMSHGTEYTSNTSPTRGHYPQNSLSESVRPLQKKAPAESKLGKGLSVKTDGKSGYKNSLVGNLPTPRSFRSGFLLPGKSSYASPADRDREQSDNWVNMRTGASKLDSVASTPQHSPTKYAAASRSKSKLPKPSSKQKQERKEKKSLGKNYKYFEGNTIFCFGGRLLNTRQARPVNLATAVVVILPAPLYFIFSAPYIWHNISPAIPLVLGYIWYICLSSFVHASAMDPGILPRRLHKNPPPDENEDPLRLAPPSNDWVLVRLPDAKPPSGHTHTAGCMEVPVRYCKTCLIWRPPRAHHCRLCDSCIETVDHHCVWINNCVGRRNYRQFFTFIVTATLGCLFILGSCLAQILVYRNRQNTSFGDAISHFPVPFALVFYSLLGLSYPAPLTVYHLFLIRRGETTREFLSSKKLPPKDRYRPFQAGDSLVRNCLVVLCRPKGPSYYQFKKGYQKGDQRLAPEKMSKGRWGFGFSSSSAEEGKKGTGEEADVELREFGGRGVPVRDGVGMVVTDLTKDSVDGKAKKVFGSWGRSKGPVLPR